MSVLYYYVTIDPFPPPLDIHLADVGHNLLKFNWTAVSNCVPLLYETSASESCGACPRHTTVASASCAFNFSHVPGVCGFAVRTIVCDNITGNWSKPINVTLKGILHCSGHMHGCTIPIDLYI